MAKLHLQKNYEFTKGDDWFYDRVIFDSLSSEVKTITITIPITAHSDIERQDDKWIPEVQE
jgi:hypothetical protein